MKNNTTYKRSWMLVLLLAFTMTSCSQSSDINKQGTSGKKIEFSTTHYKQMLRQFSLTVTYIAPLPALIEAIDQAPSNKEARLAYEDGIDAIIDNPARPMKTFFMDYFFQTLGLGAYTYNNHTSLHNLNYPVNMFVWTILNEKPISDALLEQNIGYNFDGDPIDLGNETNYNVAPTEKRAGYITMRSFLLQWYSDFKFSYSREVFALNLCDVAPWPKLNLYKWPEENMNPKYLEDPTNPIICKTCHLGSASTRYPFRKIYGTSVNFSENREQGERNWRTEDEGFVGEPLIAGYDPENITSADLMPEEDALTYMRLTPGGRIMDTPYAFAQSVVEHERFDRCWTARTIGMLSSLEFGNAGIGSKVPEDFTGTEEKQKFIAPWIEVFKENDKNVLELMRQFAKSNDYLILGYAQ